MSLAQRINWRICYLGKPLLAVIPKRAAHLGKKSGRRVVAHAPDGFLRCKAERFEQQPILILTPTECRCHALRLVCGACGDAFAGGASATGPALQCAIEQRLEGGPIAQTSRSRRIRAAAGSTRSSSPGPTRCRSITSSDFKSVSPASEPAITSPSDVTQYLSGRSPLRSSFAPTNCPSVNTNAAGPSQGSCSKASLRKYLRNSLLNRRPDS